MMGYVTREIPDAKLYLIGSGEEELFNQLQELVEMLNLQENVILVGYTMQVEKYYKKAAVFVGTAEYEGQCLTFGEAMSYAVPIVTYDMPWLPFIQDGRGIVTVPQKQYDLLANEVVRLLKNPVLCEELGHRGNNRLKK
jgi:glycosyltransferase involved in cell wall biosynthesis